MEQDEPQDQDIASELTKPVGFSIWMVAATFACVVLASVVVIAATLYWQVLKEHGGWQLAIFVGSVLVLGPVVFSAARKLEAREMARRQARGESPTPTRPPTSSLVVGVLLFGGGGVFLLWSVWQGYGSDKLDALGAAILSLGIGIACARLAWSRIRRR